MEPQSTGSDRVEFYNLYLAETLRPHTSSLFVNAAGLRTLQTYPQQSGQHTAATHARSDTHTHTHGDTHQDTSGYRQQSLKTRMHTCVRSIQRGRAVLCFSMWRRLPLSLRGFDRDTTQALQTIYLRLFCMYGVGLWVAAKGFGPEL